MRRPLPLAAVAVSALLLAGCGEPPQARHNVILVITDTVRADKLGCYGNTRGLTPSLDAFASRGLRFSRASAHAPWTLPSIASMLTGLHPAEHGAGGRLESFQPLSETVTTLPATFAAAGYDTHCIANVGFLHGEFGVTQDFAGLDLVAPSNNVEVRDARRTTDAALAWLDRPRDSHFFLLVHYFDPHAVYNPPQPFREEFAMEADRTDASWQFPTRKEMMLIRSGNLPPAEMIERAEALHDAEIAYMDAQLGRLFIGLSQRGLDTSTALAVTADHGEEFLEHGGFEHGHQLYEELTHVPLILRWPGVEPAVAEGLVGHVDLAVTLCQLGGIAPDEQYLHFGRSLVDHGGPERAVLAHGNMWSEPLTSYRVGDEKLIRRGDGTFELYDLGVDRAERNDLAGAKGERVEHLAGLLEEAQRYMRALTRGESMELSDQMREHLASQGYSGGDEE